MEERRKGAQRMADIPAEILEALNRGELETATLAEGLAIDFDTLLRIAFPELEGVAGRIGTAADAGFIRRMETAGRMLLEHLGPASFERAAAHPSDTVRGWSAYTLAAIPDLPLEERVRRVRPLADDPHFGVREWAWIALRPHLAAELDQALELLQPWVTEPSANIRRFASEITRPRGVWTLHIPELKSQPERALPLLQPLRRDPTKYVQDSVANWLNDASKTRPEWVREICAAWLADEPNAATLRICRRGMRSLPAVR